MADEGNSHLDSRAIKVRLRKPKKRFARKEWNLIRNLYSLVLPGSHKEAKQRERSGYVERDREKNRCRVEIIELNNSRERQKERERNCDLREVDEIGEAMRENTRAVGYRQRRHNNQEYDNTRDGCLLSPQTLARIPKRITAGQAERDER